MTTDANWTGRDQFDELMSLLDHPMIVVTTASGDARAGCLVGFHTQCAMEPPKYAVWLSKANHTYRIGGLADVFAIHFLAADNRPLAELFGTVTDDDDDDKFERCSWHAGPHGVPLLDDCRNRVIGRRVAWLDAGADHVCLVLDPSETTRGSVTGWLMFRQVQDFEAGHPAEDRQPPA